LYFSQNIITIMRSRSVRLVVHVARMRAKKCEQNFSWVKLKRRKPTYRRRRRRRRRIIKWILKKWTGYTNLRTDTSGWLL